MNIVVRTYTGKIIVRPDTSRDHNGEDFYVPEFVDTLEFAPVIFAHICRAGKFIERKFAPRYYDSVSFGLLFYPSALLDGSEEGFACASCLDHTSYLPVPLRDKSAASDSFEILADGKTISRIDGPGCSLIDRALEDAGRICLTRTGDFIAAELAPRTALCSRKDGTIHLSGRYNDNDIILDFKIIY